MSNLTGKTKLITGALAEGGAADAGARDNRQDGFIKVIGPSGAPTGQSDVDCASAALALVPEAASTE